MPAILIRERTLSNLFLPTEKWRNDGLFYLVRDDGTLLPAEPVPLQQGPPSPSPEMKRESNGMMGRRYLFVSRSIPALAPAP